jgi:hypothetical protein
MYEWSVLLESSGEMQDPPPSMKPIDLSKSPFFKRQQPAAQITSEMASSQTNAILEKRVEALMAPEITPQPSTESGWSREWFVDDEVER